MGCWVAVLTKNGMHCRQQHLGLSLYQPTYFYARNERGESSLLDLRGRV